MQRRAALLLLLVAAGCGTHSSPTSSAGDASAAPDDPLKPLHDYEAGRHAAADFAHLPGSDRGLGADPYALVRLPGSPVRFVGLLRGRSSLVELDASLHETARLPAPDSPTGIAVAPDGEVFVVGELAGALARYRRTGGSLRAASPLPLPDLRGLRDVAVGPEGTLYVVEEHDGRLITLRTDGRAIVRRVDRQVGHGPVRVARAGRFVVVDCLLDHTLVALPVGADGFPREDAEVRIVHDGPMWGFSAIPDADGLLLAATGVEDHPLDRTQGSFGFIDSFVYLYRVAGADASRLAAINVSELGVVVPKAVDIQQDRAGGVRVVALAAGSDRGVRLEWPGGALSGSPRTTTFPVVPGTSRMERVSDDTFAAANPLADAWLLLHDASASVVPVEDPNGTTRSEDSRLGEALLFTTLMAPWNRSDGRLSRFTCETCHFEGTVDGRTHHTGRGDVHATTKPLLGLFNNRPHFSRALDPDLTSVADNEFRVAGAKSDHDPWFTLDPHDYPWLAELGVGSKALSPIDMRRAFMAFLIDFSPRPNPAALGQAHWSTEQRAGAEVFRDRCESCHEARLVADEASSRVPFEAWEGFTLSREDPLVWAHAQYEKTGVTPYVNERGARVVSLRRLYEKYPYFTNGSAKSLHDVLERVRFGEGAFYHDAAPQDAALRGLDTRERASLLAFLDLL